LEGYTLAANYSRSGRKGGGSCIYVRNYLIFNTINITQYGIEKVSEPCAIKIDCGEHDIVIICLYRSPSGDFYQFLQLLDGMLIYLCKPRTELMLCGDLHVNFLMNSNYKLELTVLLQSYNMTNVIEFPTRINGGHGTAIDGIFINVSRANHFTVASISNGLSDHEAQYIVLDRACPYQTDLPHHKKRVINKETINYFIETIKEETWGKIYKVEHINDILMYFKYFLIHFESCFPIQYVIGKSRDNSWITPGIRISCKRKHSLYLLSKASNNTNMKSCYLLYSKILCKVIRKAKLMYYNNIITQSDNKS
jgi:hypothetical protein